MNKFNLFFNFILYIIYIFCFNFSVSAYDWRIEVRPIVDYSMSIVIVEKVNCNRFRDLWGETYWDLNEEEYNFFCKLNKKIIKENKRVYNKINNLLKKKDKAENNLDNMSNYDDHDAGWRPSKMHMKLVRKYQKQIDDANDNIMKILKSLVR